LVYIILFGKLLVQSQQGSKVTTYGRINLGWTVGEEILFDRQLQIRPEQVIAETEACLIAISKTSLSVLQKRLLESNNKKDYYVIESTLKGNFLIKDEWRKANASF